MSENPERKGALGKAAKILLWIILAVLCLLLLLAVGVRIYLSTSLPAPQLSRKVSSYLHQDLTVQKIETAGGTVILKGVRLHNPPGFAGGYLAAADSVTIGPRWLDMLRGGQRFRLIGLSGITVNLDKNGSGVWNYEQLQRTLKAGKPSPKETVIEELVIKDGSLKVQGQGVQGISLHVFDLTSKGSLDSRIDLAFEDASRTRYLVKGKARGGSDAALDLTVTAAPVSLQATAILLKVKNPSLFAGGKGDLQLNATLHKGLFSTDGDLFFSGMHLPGRPTFPLTGVLHFAADYDTRSDSANLKQTRLVIDKVTTLQAEGKVTKLRGERRFTADLAMKETDLALLNLLVPEISRKRVAAAGRIRSDSIHLEGSRRGLATASGVLELRDGTLTHEERLLATGLGGVIRISREGTAIVAKGRLGTAALHRDALLQSLDLPLAATMSANLKLLSAQSPRLSATVMGIPIAGRAGFDAGSRNPVTASLKASPLSLPELNDQLKRFGLRAEAGTASVSVDVAGKSAQDLTATADVGISGFRGKRGETSLSLKDGTSSARVERTAGRLAASGTFRFSSLGINGKTGDLRSAFSFADGMLHLDGADFASGGMELSGARISARIPAKEVQGNVSRYPIFADLDGVRIKERDVELSGLSGRLRGSFNSDSAGSWLDGTADLSSRSLAMQGKKVAAPVVHATFSRSGGRAEARGEALGGALSGTLSFNPFSREAGETFDLTVTGAKLAEGEGFLPKATDYRPTAGTVDVTAKGSYSERGGLSCRFQSKGSGIAIAGAGGKTALSGAGMSFAGNLEGGNLALTEGIVSAGEGVTLRLKGELAQALTPKRHGTIDFSLPQTSLNAMVDPFVNLLPRFIQEATLDGTVAANGKIAVQEGRNAIEGGVTFRGGKVEVPSQDLVVSGLDGRIPFSLDLSGKGEVKQPDTVSFSRENYPRLLDQLRKEPGTGEVITIDKVALGALQLGRVILKVRAENGTTEISSIKTSLFEGSLFGKGYLSMRDKLDYRADLLVNNVSLRALCSMFGDISGYITGRVDGVLSLSGHGSGLAAITGFTHLWAREGSGEKMLVSKEFLQRLAKQKLGGFLFRRDRRYDRAEIKAMLEEGDLTFDTLTIQHTNFVGVRDLSVSIAPGQNRIALDHLLASIKEAAVRGKAAPGEKPAEAPATEQFKWGE